MATDYTNQEVLLTVRDVNLTLGGNIILKGVNATVHNIVRPGLTQGQVVGFLGPSGVGKTQLCRVMAGFTESTSGSVLIKQEQIPTSPGAMGFVAQNYPLFESRTVLDNLVLAGTQGGLTRAVAKAKAEEYLERFGLAHRARAYTAALSGGQRQRVAIIRQLLCGHQFLIMDEPFSGLDPLMKEKTCEVLMGIAALDELMTIVIVTHDIHEALMVSDKLWMMGRDFGEDQKPIPGSYIKYEYDLAALGLAWHPELYESLPFMELEREVRARFRSL